MRSIYQTGILLYVWAIRLAAGFNAKARRWTQGRRRQAHALKTFPPYAGTTVWVHCASLGEFEQGRPVMEAVKKEFPSVRVVLTFFSPSGYEVRKNYAGADAVFYLPADLPGAAARFYDAVKPDLGLIVKYEFWQGYLHEAGRRQIPLYLVSGIFRPGMPFFRPYGGFFRKGLRAFDRLFVQDTDSLHLLRTAGFDRVTVCGDTRLDRVLEAVQKAVPIPAIERFKDGRPLWVCGSTWPADDALILPLAERLHGRFKLLLVPHDIHPGYIDRLILRHPKLRFAKFSRGEETAGADVLVLDTVGQLMPAYAYADWAYVGGGFGKAVHNTMEPAAYGIPVFFGPAHRKFREIAGLAEAGGGRCVHDAAELEAETEKMLQTPEREAMGRAAARYVTTHAGATARIMDTIRQKLR